ncbi:MAG: hypothetical protein IKL89_07080 [Clostridia bacterium]|nr:hypothetical protein [Clostridia bacterium]
MLANPDCCLSKAEIAEALGIACETLYAWLRNDKFIREAERLSGLYAAAEIALIRKNVISACRSGDTKAIRLLMELQQTENANQAFTPEDRALLEKAVELFRSTQMGT